mgnify:CR=1 FL=1
MQVFIVDDDPMYRQWLQQLLESWDFPVRAVGDGTEAIHLAEAGLEADLVLLDWDLPGADGFEVARCLRSQDRTAGAYVLMITGSRNKDDLVRVLVSSADDYLIKPFDPLDLKIHLRTAMRLRHLQHEVESLRGERATAAAPGR